MKIYELCEIIMLICFGFSWPFNVMKSYRARTTKGKSLAFLILVIVGYLCGIIAKLTSPVGYKWYVMFFYVLNTFMVVVDLCMYFRNLKLDRAAAKG